MSSSTSLNAARRAGDLTALEAAPNVDVLVVGGGVTGAGVALDAVSRGLSTVLVERRDLAFGTSRWSSKLVHGGLRYLASGAVGIAHESAVERGVLIERTAPHLVHPFPQLIPLLPETGRAKAAMLMAGLLAGDVLRASARTSHHTLPHPCRITRAEAQRYAPAMRNDGLRGGLLFWDGQLTDDARLVTAIARTAAGEVVNTGSPVARSISSCRRVRSPDAPKTTSAHGSGVRLSWRPSRSGFSSMTVTAGPGLPWPPRRRARHDRRTGCAGPR
jgi:glycerol-3-phosphate dehydrogenase